MWGASKLYGGKNGFTGVQKPIKWKYCSKSHVPKHYTQKQKPATHYTLKKEAKKCAEKSLPRVTYISPGPPNTLAACNKLYAQKSATNPEGKIIKTSLCTTLHTHKNVKPCMFILLVGVKCLSYNASNGVNYQKSETAPIFLCSKRLFCWGHVCTGCSSSSEIGTNWLWKYKNQNKHTYLCEMHAAYSTCLTAHFTQVLIFALSSQCSCLCE